MTPIFARPTVVLVTSAPAIFAGIWLVLRKRSLMVKEQNRMPVQRAIPGNTVLSATKIAIQDGLVLPTDNIVSRSKWEFCAFCFSWLIKGAPGFSFSGLWRNRRRNSFASFTAQGWSWGVFKRLMISPKLETQSWRTNSCVCYFATRSTSPAGKYWAPFPALIQWKSLLFRAIKNVGKNGEDSL